METQDTEIQEFVSGLKRKKLMRRLVWLGIGAAVVLVAVLVLLFLKGR